MARTRPDEETTGRREAWLKAHEGWDIQHKFGVPGWWEATVDDEPVARYDDLGNLMDRLELMAGA